MNKIILLYFCMFFIPLAAQMPMTGELSIVRDNKPFDPSSYIHGGNYSGITYLGNDVYAVVNDKAKYFGFHRFKIVLSKKTGKILWMADLGFFSKEQPNSDTEDIVYLPVSNTFFIASEQDNRIREINNKGDFSGRELHLPLIFGKVKQNAGLEALAYNKYTKKFWTTTESPLLIDEITSENQFRLRLQSFDEDLEPTEQYAYLSDSLPVCPQGGRRVAGVSAITALDDGRLLVLERYVIIPRNKIGAYSTCKIYVVNPLFGNTVGDEPLTDKSPYLEKTLLGSWTTRLNLFDRSFANYEGLCLGPKLADGSQVVLMIADSQNQYYGFLSDWIKTIVIR